MKSVWTLLLAGVIPGLGSQMVAQVAPAAPQSTDIERRIHQMETCLPSPVMVKGETGSCKSLAQTMQELHVPGVSVAVVHHGAIEWARGFGVMAVGGSPVTPDTIFQAGSISKPVAAMAALYEVQEGKLSLDADVNTELKSWKLPASSAAPGATVTLRELLTHTGGTTVHGFPGYAAGKPVPTLEQVLDGAPPANTAAIRIEAVPGSKWNYSGGGYTIMQHMVIDATHEPFPKLLHDVVLAPIGMTHSTYEQPLPAARQAEAATPYQGDGQPVPGGFHTYPEMAAAGLWTTPSDLARYILEVQQSLKGQANHVLSQAMTQQLVQPGKGDWGLGVQIGGSPQRRYFSHGGVNDGFEAFFFGYEDGSEGAVVMTNAQGGTRVAMAVIRSLAAAYNWPDFQPVVRTEVAVDPAVLARYVGTYQLQPGFDFTFTVEGGHLMGQITGQPKLQLYPEAENRFFLKVVDAEVEFVSDAAGQVNAAVLHQGGQDHKAMKTK